MRVIVGVDAGGTSTVAAACCDGMPERVHEGPSSNAASRGIEPAAETITETILAALNGALPDAIYVGAAGAGRRDVAEELEQVLSSRFPRARVRVADDAQIALRAAVPEGDAAVLIAGTGSIAYAERGGQAFRSGGYGYLLGDDGSGFALGAAAIRHALRTLDDERAGDELTSAIVNALEAANAQEVLGRIYGSPDPVREVAAMARIVLETASAGERFAARIVQDASAKLYDLIADVVRKAAPLETDAPIVLSGGLLRENTMLTFLLETRLRNDLPNMPVRKSGVAAYRGALACAERLIAA